MLCKSLPAWSKFKFCFLELSGIFFFPNIFNPQLVESAEAELEDTDGRLHTRVKTHQTGPQNEPHFPVLNLKQKERHSREPAHCYERREWCIWKQESLSLHYRRSKRQRFVCGPDARTLSFQKRLRPLYGFQLHHGGVFLLWSVKSLKEISQHSNSR